MYQYKINDNNFDKVIKSLTCIIGNYKVLYEELEDEITAFMNYYKGSNISNINDFVGTILDKGILKEIDRYIMNKILKIISKNVKP